MITKLKDINTETPEGRLLIAAISKLQAKCMQGQTAAEVLQNLNTLSDKIYSKDDYAANDNKQRDPRPFIKTAVFGTDEIRKTGNADLGD